MGKKISRIIRYNRWLKYAKLDKDFKHYEEIVLKIHRMEIDDNVPIGSYILKIN